MRFANQVALVTGGTGGLGKAVSLALLAEGNKLIQHTRAIRASIDVIADGDKNIFWPRADRLNQSRQGE